MKLHKIKCRPLERAKNLVVSPSYVVGLTGQKAVILDRHLNLLHVVDGLSYVYAAQISPDESKLLLIANTNHFHIVDLQTFEKTRVTVKAPYNESLAGIGCWSFDGKSVWIAVQRHTPWLNSTLRCYSLEDLNAYRDYLPDRYVLLCIRRTEKTGTYFLMGYDREAHNRHFFAYFDGTSFQIYPLEEAGCLIAPSADVDMNAGVVTVCSYGISRRFTLDGKRLPDLEHPAPAQKTISASQIAAQLFPEVQEVPVQESLENIPVRDSIMKVVKSACGKYRYLASQSGFYVLDAREQTVLAVVEEAYGVQGFEELAPGVLGLATWTGTKLYQIAEE